MKRLTVGLAALLSGYVANSFAALPTSNTSKCDVCVPNYCGGFTFGLTGLYWRPSSPLLDYALTYPSAYAFTSGSTTSVSGSTFSNGCYHNTDHRYDWGFKANIGYVFPCSGNDVYLTYTNWTHSNTDRPGNHFGFILPATSLGSSFATSGLGLSPTFVTSLSTIPVTGTALLGAAAATFATTLPSTTLTLAIDPSTITIADIYGKSRLQDHTWDLDFGQGINVGCNFRMRWFGGLRYSRLERDLDIGTLANFASTTPSTPATGLTFGVTTAAGTVAGAGTVAPVFSLAGTINDYLHQKSDFNGIGPRFGVDASYHLGGGFGVIGNIATSLLIGRTHDTSCETVNTAGTVSLVGTAAGGSTATIAVDGVPLTSTLVNSAVLAFDPATLTQVFSFSYDHENRVVPNIDAKLGLDWTYQFCNCSRTKLTIEAGWMVSHYFNAVDRLTSLAAFGPDLSNRRAADVSFDGPYLNVQVNL